MVEKIYRGIISKSPYIEPTETLYVKENGIFDVLNYRFANVNVPIPEGYLKPEGTLEVSIEGTYDVTLYASVKFEVETEKVAATPTKETQTFTPSENKFIDKVVVNPIPSEYLVPSGKIDITNTDEIDVTQYASAQIKDENLKAENIAENQTVLGILGTHRGGINTSDATATSEDILLGETAYVNEEKIVGTIETYALETSEGIGVNSLKRLLDYTKSSASMFQDHSNITSVSDFISYNDTENVTSMGSMFRGASNLIEGPNMNTSKVKNMSYMYQSTSITETPKHDFSKVTTAVQMYSSCKKLVKVNQMSFPSAITIANLFNGCISIVEIPEILDTTRVDNAASICYGCTALETFGGMDMIGIKAHNQTSNFVGCVNLKNIKLKNIQVNTTIGSGDGTGTNDYGTMITVDSLIGIIAELINVGVTKTLTVGTANLNKLSSIYVKLLEDDGSGKLPFEVCESTDDSAILITDYIVLKNWAIA